MAKKKKSKPRLPDPPPNMIYVNSSTYGGHYRAKRGSKSPITVNDSLQANNDRVVVSNAASKLMRDALESYRTDFTSGQLHQRLVSLFQKQLIDTERIAFSGLKDFEVHEDFTFQRFFPVRIAVAPDRENSRLSVDLRSHGGPDFKQRKNIERYTITVIVVYPDLAHKDFEMDDHVIANLGVNESLNHHVSLRMPEGFAEYLICLKITGAFRDGDSKSMGTKGMRIVAVGPTGNVGIQD